MLVNTGSITTLSYCNHPSTACMYGWGTCFFNKNHFDKKLELGLWVFVRVKQHCDLGMHVYFIVAHACTHAVIAL